MSRHEVVISMNGSWLRDKLAATAESVPVPDSMSWGYAYEPEGVRRALAGHLFDDPKVRKAVVDGLERARSALLAEWREEYLARAERLEAEATAIREMIDQ